MTWALTLFRRLILMLAWLVFLGALGLLVVEESGILAQATRGGLAWRLGPLGAGLEVGKVRLRWFEPGIELLRVRLVDPTTDTELVYLRSVHFSLDLNLKDRPLRQLEIEGGRTRISDGLLAGIEQLSEHWGDQEIGGNLRPPPILLRNFEVDLELPRGGVLALGKVDLLARPLTKDRFSLRGKILPTLSGAIRGEAPVTLEGKLDSAGLDLSIRSTGLHLDTVGFRLPSTMSELPIEDFSGALDLIAEGHIRFGKDFEAAANLRARIREARLLPRRGDPWLENLEVEVDVETEYRPGLDTDIWARDVWRATSRAQADWNGTPVEVWSQFGRDVPTGAWARSLVRAPRLPLGDATMKALGIDAYGRGIRTALRPRGMVDASLELLLDREFNDEGVPIYSNKFAAQLRHTGNSGLTFRGFVSPVSRERIGIDIPIEGVRGRTLITFDSQLASPLRLVFADVAGNLPTGSLGGWAGITANPNLKSDDFQLELAFAIPPTELDREMLNALRTSPLTRDIWRDFDPRGGRIATEWRLIQNESTGGFTAQGDVIVSGASMRWHELPVPMHGVNGAIHLRWTPNATACRTPTPIPLMVPVAGGGFLPQVTVVPRVHRALGVAFDFRNDGGPPHLGLTAHVAGYVREESLPEGHEPEDWGRDPIHELHIEIEEVPLRGAEWDILAVAFPDAEEERRELEAVGEFQLRIVGGQHHYLENYFLDIEAEATRVEVTPELFPHRTEDVRGRLLMRSDLDDEATRMRFAVAGEWPEGTEIAAFGEIPPTGLSHMEVYAGGVDTNNRALRGALQAALDADREEDENRVDMSDVAVTGQVDLRFTTDFDAEDETYESEDEYRLYLRNSYLEVDDLKLDHLHGELEWTGDLWRSRRVDGELGGHPVQLEDVMMYSVEDLDRIDGVDPLLLRGGYLAEADGIAIQGIMSTTNLPLDAEHLANLMDEETLAPLREHEDWTGEIDLLGTRLLATSTSDHLGQVLLYGPLRVHDMQLPGDLPMEVRSADIDLAEFVLEQGSIRAWGSVEDFSASFADRELSDARMIFGFVDGRLTVDNLEGEFEGGRITSLGATGQGSRKAVGVDISEPHRFDVAFRFEDLDLGSLMRGVFESSIADTGILSGSLQLSGKPGDILGLSGRGAFDLTEGRLWSIPAARELFSRLGFPNTGVFNRLEARFEIRDGMFLTHDIRVRSALLKLVGTGTFDFDGSISYDLDVRYSILDKLGILNRVLYWLNRNLWRVAVRGDYQRPFVLIRSSFLELLLGSPEDPRRPLPLPEFAPLGDRF